MKFVITAVVLMGLSLGTAHADVKEKNAIVASLGAFDVSETVSSFLVADVVGEDQQPTGKKYLLINTAGGAHYYVELKKKGGIGVPENDLYVGAGAVPGKETSRPVHSNVEVSVDNGDPDNLRLYVTLYAGEQERQWQSGWLAAEPVYTTQTVD